VDLRAASALASWMKCTVRGVRRTMSSTVREGASFSKAGRKRFSSQPTPTSLKEALNFIARAWPRQAQEAGAFKG